MTEHQVKHIGLYRSQRILWYVLTIAFGIATVMYSLDLEMAFHVALGATVLLMANNVFELVLIAIGFAREKRRQLVVITLLLVFVLAGVALVGVLRA